MIIPETPEHFDAVRQLTIEAFAASTLGHHGEADLIVALRQRCEHTLSLVAMEDERVVGHIPSSDHNRKDREAACSVTV